MNYRALKKTIATLSLLAYVWVGLGVGTNLVYCIGSDGHSGIEQAHGYAPCSPAGDGHSSDVAPSDVALGTQSCTDIPLLAQVSKEQEKLGELASITDAAVTAIASRPPFADPRGTHRALHHRLASTHERSTSLRTTVLRV